MKADLKRELFGIASYEEINSKRVLFCFVTTVFCICVNYAGSVLAEIVIIPLYLDSLLTIGLAGLCGLIPALFCALLSNIVLSLFTHCSILFSITNFSSSTMRFFN